MINKGGGFPFVGSSRLLLCLCKSQELRVSTLDLFLIAGLFNFAIHNPTCKINYPKSKDIIVKVNNSDYLQKARKYGHFTGYKN